MAKTIPEYEERSLLNHLGKYRDKLVITRTTDFAEELARFKEVNAVNPLEQFLEMVMYEIREVKAFI